MAASTDIKFYVHTNTSAPQLDNVQGGMIAVLDAVLVNGFGSQAVSSITATGTTATVTFGSAHNYMRYQVIRITGAAQAEYNGQHRILTVPTATTLTFELTATPSASPATGTITCDLPPLGFNTAFTATGRRAYQSSTAGSPYLRVVDEVDAGWNSTYAKYAKVGIVEGMTDINTMIGAQAPYDSTNPNKNWELTGTGTNTINGWAKWFYSLRDVETTNSQKSAVPANGVRPWIIVGDGDTFYIFNKTVSNLNNTHVGYGFGRLTNLSKVDASPYFLAATDDYYPAINTVVAAYSMITATATSAGGTNPHGFMLRNYKNEAINTLVNSRVFAGTGATELTGYNTAFADPSAEIAVFSSNYILVDSSPVVPRGQVPILKWLHQRLPYTHLQTFAENNRAFVACSCASYNQYGQILFDLGDL